MKYLSLLLLLGALLRPVEAQPTSIAKLVASQDFEAATKFVADVARAVGRELPAKLSNLASAPHRATLDSVFVLSTKPVLAQKIRNSIVISPQKVLSDSSVSDSIIIAGGDIKVRYNITNSLLLSFAKVQSMGSVHKSTVQAETVKLRGGSFDSEYINVKPTFSRGAVSMRDTFVESDKLNNLTAP